MDTNVALVTATTSAAGNIQIDELNAIMLTSINAANGNVAITAGGAMTATSVTAGGAGDMILSVTAGGIAVGMLDAAGDMIELSAPGGLTDGDAAIDITAADMLIVATGGVGSGADPLETAVSQLVVQNSVAGDIGITNTGALNLTTLTGSLLGSLSSVTNSAGAITIVALSPLSVNVPVSALGAVILTATDSGAAGDDLAVNASVTSTGSSVTLNAGDNATISANLSASTTVDINIDAGDQDPLVGATLNIPTGVVITATSATFTGATQADAFNFAPQATTPINVFGLAPFANPGGDTMLLDTAAPVTNPTLNILGGQGAGLYTFGNRANVQYASIENATTTTPIHIALDSTATLVENIRLQRSTGGGTDFEVYDTDTTNLLYAGPIVNVLSFLFLGSANANTVAIDDVNGLVDLAGTVPAPTGVGDNGNVTGTFLRFSSAATAGRMRSCSRIPRTRRIRSTASARATAPGSQAGEVYTTNAALALSVYFDGIEGVTSNDATSGGCRHADHRRRCEPRTRFHWRVPRAERRSARPVMCPSPSPRRRFNAAIVNAGDGNNSITLVSLNAAESGLALALNGQVGADTITVQSASAGNTLALQGGVDNDTYQLGGAANTVDNILVPITIADTSGVDSLTLVDSADLSGDVVTITDSTIDGVNAAPSPNVLFSRDREASTSPPAAALTRSRRP